MITFDLLIGMLIVSGISMAAVGLYARRFSDRVPAATPFILLMFGAAAWAILYALDLLTTPLSLKVAYHNLRFLFLPFLPVLELWLVLAYVNRTGMIRREWWAAILVIPVFSAVLAVTSPYHSLFRYNFTVAMAGPVPVLHYSESVFYQIYNAYSLAILVLAILFLIGETQKKHTLRETPTIFLIAALAFPTVINYITQYTQYPFPGINPTPAVLWIAAILYAVSLFRYRFLDIIPIARSRLVDALNRPVLVLDTRGRVIDMNPAACSLFSMEMSSALGNPIDAMVPDWPEFLDLCCGTATRTRDLVRETDQGTYHFIGTSEPLLTRNGEVEGHLIFLQDVTDLRRAERALQEKTHALTERIKEIRCLYEISRIIETHPPGDALFQAIADAIPTGWQYPESTGARIIVEGGEYRSANCHESPWKQAADISINGTRTGTIEIFLPGTGGPPGKEPFLPEEALLLHAIAERIGRLLERIRAEDALQEKTEELDQYFSTSLDLFCIADTQGYFRRLNPEWETSLGYSRAELEGQRFLDFVHPDDLQATLDAMADLRERKAVLNFTNRYRHRDGSYRWIEWRSIPKGERIFAAARDITGRKQMEEALRESEEKYRAIIDEMQDIFYRTDNAGTITMLSPSAARVAGYDSNDRLIGRDVTVMYADPAGRERLLLEMKKMGSVYAYPLDLKIRDGTIRHVTTSSHFYRDAKGQIRGIEGVIHDVTDQRRAEEALRMANKKLTLLSSVTRHDIRNQLMALMAYLELSRESIENPKELAEILKKNQRIADTIARQIAFTKDYEDLGVKAPVWQDVGVCIRNAVEELPVKGTRIGNETDGLEIFADPLMEKVFYNLIDNALRYGGERMTEICMWCRTEGDRLVLVFEDNGAGIPEPDKALIFDRGFVKNTGLGLYLSREILAITGILITETGIPGKGARFELTIPADGFRFRTSAEGVP